VEKVSLLRPNQIPMQNGIERTKGTRDSSALWQSSVLGDSQ